MQHEYTYESTLAAARKVHWNVDDLIGGDRHLDFGRPFLPETLARVRGIDFLSPEEQTVLNQVRGHGYLYMFGIFSRRPVLNPARGRGRGAGRFFSSACS